MKAKSDKAIQSEKGQVEKKAQQPAMHAADTTVRVLPERVNAFAIIAQSRVGMAHLEVRQLATLLDLTIRELATLLSMNERTMARRLVSGSLNKVESERLLLLKGLAQHGFRVFEDQGKFNRWLRRPLEILDGQSPLQLLDTATGFQVVDQILGRIEYGVYS